jgi:hypothetical protein
MLALGVKGAEMLHKNGVPMPSKLGLKPEDVDTVTETTFVLHHRTAADTGD